jgi:hypothetical protein
MLRIVWDVGTLMAVGVILTLVALVAVCVLAGVVLGGWLVHRANLPGNQLLSRTQKGEIAETEGDLFEVPDVVARMGAPFNPDPDWPWTRPDMSEPPSPTVKWQNERFREQLNTGGFASSLTGE